ncbi:MAG: flagellar hook-associated protein FlgK [Chromatiales bacterium]|nr:flagellar hook-associated protein FlgK [Chromatiales bacterium]
MADLFGIGTSALSAFQRALATTGHNISNVNTDSYSRQRVELINRPGNAAGNGFIGTGVDSSTVRRMFDQFVQQNLVQGHSAYEQQQMLYSMASQVDSLLADPDTGLSTGLQNFFGTLHELADDPTSTAARQLVLTEGETLANRFNYLYDQLEQLRSRANNQIRTTVDEINGIAASIADVNRTIGDAYAAGGGQPPNDLLDKRDALVTQLAKLVSVQTFEQDNGALNVFIGNGQALVVNAEARQLGAGPLGPDINQLDIGVASGGATIDITDFISGGRLGGLLEYRDSVLDPTENAIGRVAIGLASVFNEQHQKGMDLDGDLGQAFFTVPTATVLPDTGNGSTLNVTIADVSRLTTDDYELRFDGANWNLTRQSDGQPVAMTGTGTAADPFLVDGLAMEVGGAPAAGDVYVIRPTRAGARQLDTLLTNVRDIAAAYPVQGQADIGNTGSATIDGFEILDATDPNLRTAVTLTYDAGTGEFSDGTNTYPYTSGGNIDINGWRVRITGTPQDGDVFSFTDNTGGVGDNRNALALVALQNTNTLGANATGTPSASFGEAYNELVSDVGTRTRSAEIASNAQKGLLDQAQSRREAVSGVNLDEEAANLLRFQQAYQAAAQIISIANQNFQTLITAVGR